MLVVYGATGSTGRRLVELAVAGGVQPVVAGRRRAALEEVAAPYALEVRVGERDDLDRVFADATVVVSSAGPYSRIGRPVVEAAVRAGAHYIDFSGEPRWVMELVSAFDAPARAAGCALVPSVGVGVAGDLAAQAATRELAHVDELTIGYRIVGMKPSTATLRSTVELIAAGAPVSTPDGPEFVPAGARTRDLPDGRAVLFPTPDALLLGRVYPAARVECYMHSPLMTVAAPGFRLTGRALRRPRVLAAARRLVEAGPLSSLHGSGGRGDAVAVARGGGRETVARASVDDVYEVSARGAWVAARRLLDVGGVPGVRTWGEVTGEPGEAAAAARVDMYCTRT